jgi:hypothetical protein
MTGARLQAIGYRRRNALTEFNANRLDHRDALSATRPRIQSMPPQVERALNLAQLDQVLISFKKIYLVS